jgi:hypothetical protein
VLGSDVIKLFLTQRIKLNAPAAKNITILVNGPCVAFGCGPRSAERRKDATLPGGPPSAEPVVINTTTFTQTDNLEHMSYGRSSKFQR